MMDDKIKRFPKAIRVNFDLKHCISKIPNCISSLDNNKGSILPQENVRALNVRNRRGLFCRRGPKLRFHVHPQDSRYFIRNETLQFAREETKRRFNGHERIKSRLIGEWSTRALG